MNWTEAEVNELFRPWAESVVFVNMLRRIRSIAVIFPVPAKRLAHSLYAGPQ